MKAEIFVAISIIGLCCASSVTTVSAKQRVVTNASAIAKQDVFKTNEVISQNTSKADIIAQLADNINLKLDDVVTGGRVSQGQIEAFHLRRKKYLECQTCVAEQPFPAE